MTNNDKSAKALLNKRLSDQQVDVIENKATERPFTGKLLSVKGQGTFICARCKSPLYHSVSKFESSCGWPSFDQEIEGAVIKTPDADGRRTEILCAACGGHLGHVFTGEGFTPLNTRHCVNSLSMNFVPSEGETGRAVFAGGCFWGVEHLFKKKEGVLETNVGYSGGSKAFPTYQDVLSHKTGHYEVVEIIYDIKQTSFEVLAKYFFEIHDPTQANGQGPDLGEQYLSVVFYENENQKKTTEALISQLETKGYKIVTQLKPAAAFWPAEVYHQNYYELKGSLPYCHSYTSRF